MKLRKKNIAFFIILILLVLKNDTLSAQIKVKKTINSEAEFNISLKLYKEISENQFNISKHFTNTNEAIGYFENAITWANSNENIDLIIKAKVNILGFYKSINNNIEKIARVRDLLKYDQIYKSILIRDLLYDLKQVYRQTEQFSDFLKILPDYHKYSKIYGYKEVGEENYDCEIAFVNYRLKNYEKAIESYKKCANSLFNGGKIFPLSSTINNIGLCFSKIKNIDSAKYYYNKSIHTIELYKKKNVKKDLGYVNHFVNVIESNIASLDTTKRNYNKILPFYYKELKSGKKYNEKNIITSAHYNIAEIYYKQERVDLALAHIDSVSAVLKSYNNSSIKKKLLNLKAKIFLLKGRFNSANRIFEKYDIFIDSIDTEKAKKEYLIGVIKHETNLRTKELEESRFKNELDQKTLFLQWIVIGLLIVSLLIFFYFIWKVRRNHITIKNQKEILNIALNEKEILLKEIHHRVKNNLQVISGLLFIQSSKKKRNSVEVVLEQSQRQIESMSLIHEMLYNKDSLSKIPIEDYLSKLSGNLLSIYSKKNIKLIIEAPKIDLHIDFANPIGLIINELITNSLKHGFNNLDSGIINIKFILKERDVEFEYSDNGVGITFLENASKTNFGNRLIKMLAEEIRATYEINSDNGLTYIFKFKI